MPKKSKPETGRRFDRRAHEMLTAKINQIIRDGNFSSEEELNAFLADNLSDVTLDDIEYAAETALERAQQIVWDAFDQTSSKKRIAMALQALEISEDCADAYSLLAEDRAKTADEAIELLRRAVAAGERALGKKVLDDPETMYWSDLKTRPYMRAIASLACVLRDVGEKHEAIALWKKLLQMNPDDNQGVRWLLAPLMIEEGQLDDAQEVLDDFEDDFVAHMLYSRALCLFKKRGDTIEACDALRKALDENRYVMEYMAGVRRLPKTQASSFRLGSPEEAAAYVYAAGDAWDDEACRWVNEYMKRELRKTELERTFPGLSDARGHGVDNVVNLATYRKD